MSAVDLLLLIAGIIVMLLVMGGMFLLTPRGTVAVRAEGSDGQGSDLSAANAPGAGS